MRIATCMAIALLIPTTLTPTAQAQELLSNGDFDIVADLINGWTLEESRTADPSAVVNAAAPAGFANNPGGTAGEVGLWLRSFVGNPTDGTADAVLSQTVAATPGETYTFSGEAAFEQNFSGGVAFLDLLSDWGEIPSPTDATFRLEFLDAGGSVLAFDEQNVAANVFNGAGYTAVDPIQAVAPALTVSARVVAEATEMAINIDPGQSAFYDNFSLTAQSDPSTELLINADLNDSLSASQNFVDFDVTESPEGTDTLQLAGFANNTPDGAQGVWLRAFLGGDGSVSQTVAATPGAEYTFTAASRWEENYSGGVIDTSTETTLALEFLDSLGELTGTPVVLDLTTEQMNDNMWRTHTLTGTAPVEAVSVRVSGNAVGMFETEGGQSAFFDDFSLVAGGVGPIEGDFNGDGSVDNSDLNLLLNNWGQTDVSPAWINGLSGAVDNEELNALLNNWGTGTSVAVPEPTSLLLASLLAAGVVRRRR